MFFKERKNMQTTKKMQTTKRRKKRGMMAFFFQERQMSLQCLQEHNDAKEKCSDYFANVRNCLKFWVGYACYLS